MSGEYKKIKGFADLFNEQSLQFTAMENMGRLIFSRYCFEEMRTPILEFTDLFQRSIGDETDVVQKEMFTFNDRKGRSMTMRPEATAGVMRAVIEAGLARSGTISRLFTFGPMFRYERPQKGRMRQFHQVNCEMTGTDSPFADAEVITMLMEYLAALGLKGLKLKINSLGCKLCRKEYLAKLGAWLASQDADQFCEDCKRRVSANPLRVLDCKEAGCRKITENAPRLIAHICPECGAHHEKVLQLLASQGIAYEIDHHLVRGLDYYMRTTFEVVSDNIGAQTAVAGGGRYDGLIHSLGGEDIPGIGFACGMERLALLMEQRRKANPDFFILGLDMNCMAAVFGLAEKLRQAGFCGEMNYVPASMKSLLRKAARSQARWCLILGENELKNKEIVVKNMENGEQGPVPLDNVAAWLQARSGQ